MRRYFTLIFIALFFSLSGQNERFKTGGGQSESEESQQKEKPKKGAKKSLEQQAFLDRLVFGGGFGLSFGNTTQIMLAPQVGYKQTENLITGVGFIYNYLNVNQAYNRFTGRFEPIDFENTIYGPNVFVDYFLFDKGFVGAQLEVLNFDNYGFNQTTGAIDVNNIWGSVLWLEGGYLTRLGGNSYVQLGVRANVLHGNSSPYATWWTPMISFFF